MKYIYQYRNWTDFIWDEKEVHLLLGKVRYLQGMIFGRINALGFSLRNETLLNTLTLDVLGSSEIEGEILDHEQVRSSIARRLGLEYAGMVHSDRYVEGVVEMMLDATRNFNKPLDEERLFSWHAALFPTGRSGLHKIDVGSYRTGEMQVVSGAMGKEKIHYQAPPPREVRYEMDRFLDWFNTDNRIDLIIKSAIAHFRFIIIHPFDDGNGRIARAISDLLLARSEQSSHRFYSLSDQILRERKAYYETLQKTQYKDRDITEWILWFMNCLYRALENTESTIKRVVHKADFWDRHKDTELNSRQRLMINKLLDGFSGKLKTSKWARITRCSQDTALRDIKDLIGKGILRQDSSGGRSTSYVLNERQR